MSRATSASTNLRYGVALVCRVWRIARSTFYSGHKRLREEGVPLKKRGPKTALDDDQLLEEIRKVLQEMEAEELRGEGHRKVWARLRHRGHQVGRQRVLRVMRENKLLAPTRIGSPRGPRVHDGTIKTEQPDQMWGTDATRVWTRKEGLAWVFVAIDHCTAECVGIHAAQIGTRFEALEPVRQGVNEYFGEFDEGVAAGLLLRHDWGPQYTSDDFQLEIAFLGIESSPSFAYAPEGNGIAERFIRTLKEQLLWVRTFDTVDELRTQLLDFKERYNRLWILERHEYPTPAQVRENFDLEAVA